VETCATYTDKPKQLIIYYLCY